MAKNSSSPMMTNVPVPVFGSDNSGNRDKGSSDYDKVRNSFWNKFRRVAGRLPFARDLVAAYYCAMDPATPSHVRYVLIGALLYFIMPVDMLPDFIIGLGYTDDAAILAAAIKKVADHITPVHKQAADDALSETRNL